MLKAQTVDWSGDHSKNFRKQRRHVASPVPGGELKQYKWIVIVRVLENGTTVQNPGTPN